jgi:hypothetical protein
LRLWRGALPGDGRADLHHNCHRRRCQQQTGGTSIMKAFFEAERVLALMERGKAGED